MTAGRRADLIPHVPFKEKPTLLETDAVVSEARDADSEHGDDDHQR
jgi:hypothetical protein